MREDGHLEHLTPRDFEIRGKDASAWFGHEAQGHLGYGACSAELNCALLLVRYAS